MALSTIASWAGPAVSTVATWAGTSVVQNLVKTAFSYLNDHMLPPNSEAELKRLQTALPQITAVIGIAELLKMKHPDAGQWVDQFRMAVEASEDVLDELEYKRLENMVKNEDAVCQSVSSSKKRKSCTINDDTLERLKKAVAMLDQVVVGVERLLQLATLLGIHDLSESRQGVGKILRCESTSFLAEREVFGREVEKDKIICWLKRPTDARLSSFGIVGVGGLGKTTLVQFVYQEMCRVNHFSKTIWVCVSNNFRVEDITRKMLSELGENSCCGMPLNALQGKLKEKIHLKKILLILDDVWDDEKRRDWEQLVAPLRFVQEGSKIIFTTRMKSVADLLASVISMEHESLTLQGLCEQELRLLFNSYAFYGFNPNNHSDLQTFGDQILKMLRGSPLAVKVIGSLLNSHMDYHYWRRILDHGSLFNLEQTKDVMDVLKLSYYYLPIDLQVCFRFCSTFPDDYAFNKTDLIKMWIASGFVGHHLSQEERLEDIGEDYFNLLLRKSFFEYSHSYEGTEKYVMHDLMHELAQNVSYGECCRVEPNQKSITIPSTIRHVCVYASEIDRISHLGNLRSLSIIINLKSFILPNNLLKKPLRLLKIKANHIFELPEEISWLVHLHYPTIEVNYRICQPISYSLLASIYQLYHLQVLEFSTAPFSSSYSGIETTGMTNLLRLRHLKIPENTIQTIHGIHKLTSLQELTFFIGQENGCRINELGTLNNLRHLSIQKIENIGDAAEAKSTNLLGKNKNNLISLFLKWTTVNNPDHSKEIIDCLQPHPKLMELTITNYNGQRSPNWMEESPPLNLLSLKLFNCPLWKNQLFSRKMSYLKILDISDCLNMNKFPDMPLSLIEFRICNVGLTLLPDLYQSSNNNTPTSLSLKSSLTKVEISRCPNLISLNGFLQQENLDLQAIESLTIEDCERLENLPIHGFGNLKSLMDLTLIDCPKLVVIDFRGNLLPTELEALILGNCGEVDIPLLEAPFGLTTLTHMDIIDCPNLTRLPSLSFSVDRFVVQSVGLSALPEYYQSSDSRGDPSLKSSLYKVDIICCPRLIALGGFLLQDNIDFQSIETIEVTNCWNLIHLPIGGFGKFVSLYELTIRNCPMLEVVDNQSNLLPTKLEELLIENCGELDVPLLESASSLPILTKLMITNCENISYIPSSVDAFRSLSFLSINECDKLVQGGVKQGSNFESLKLSVLEIDALPLLLIEPLKSLRFVRKLLVWNCSAMEALPEQWLLANSNTLLGLAIENASSLKSLPTTMTMLTSLQWLRINIANLLEELPKLPASLLSLYVTNASSLKSLPNTMVELNALEDLEIWHADLLEELPELPASLKRKKIQGCGGQWL